MASIKFKKSFQFNNKTRPHLVLKVEKGDTYPLVESENEKVWTFEVEGQIFSVCKKDSGCPHNHDEQYDIVE